MTSQLKADKLEIAAALVEDHVQLTDLTLRSKASWGYSVAQMESWREILTITPEYIRRNKVFIARFDRRLAGYYSWIRISGVSVELDNMFVAPEFIGQGIGKRLMLDFLHRMKKTGIKEIALYADPNAAPFYAQFGFIVTGRSESNIKPEFD